MRLLCINDSGWEEIKKGGWFSKDRWVASDGPRYGDEVTCIGENTDEYGEYYLLKEWPEDETGYEKECFIPLTGDKEEVKESEYNLIHQLLTLFN